jgi:hypothetical protein
VPDPFGITQYGVVYTGGKGKIAERGGAHADDLDVPLVVSGAATPRGARVGGTVETTQIACADRVGPRRSWPHHLGVFIFCSPK